MKIRFDENVSHRVASAVTAYLANKAGFEVSHVRDDNEAKTSDPTWIKRFADADGDAIVSGDTNILQHWPDLVAYTESGLISFFPPNEYKVLSGYGRAAFFIRWWPTIVEHVKGSARGDRWRLPMSWVPDPTKIKALQDPRLRTDEQKQELGIQPIAKVYGFRP